VQWATTAGEVLLDRLLHAGLTERRAVVLLNAQAGWTVEQIHEALGVAESTVKGHLSAARKILREISKSD
jgi:DNA-directed RNA polymerase specialized sigma24 family protein